MVTEIRENFEVIFIKKIWSSTMEEVLETLNSTFSNMNKKLVEKILIECISVHWRPCWNYNITCQAMSFHKNHVIPSQIYIYTMPVVGKT
jgi:hypothetical protein